MMRRDEFVEHCVLTKDMPPDVAVRLFRKVTEELAREMDPGHCAQTLDAVRLLLDGIPPKARTTALALLRERYDEKTGEVKQ